MNNEIKVPTMEIAPLKKICMTIGELPSSYLETMTYYEMLIWFTNYLKDSIIPAVNNNAEATHELQELFVQLQSYVNNYFDNLDIQEEINNKLDDMLENGQLEQIIEQYLQSSALWCFDTVADMKEASNLINGSYAKTLGYHAKNDGGSTIYKIREITNEDVVDEGSIIALNDITLVAELISKDIKPEYFGAYGDQTHDDTEALQNAIDYANTTERYEVILTNKYLTSEPITLYSKILLKGVNTELNDYSLVSYIKNETSDIFYLTLIPSTTNPSIMQIRGLNILNLGIIGNDNNKLFSNSNASDNRTRLNWGIIDNCYFRRLQYVFQYCQFTGFQIRNTNFIVKSVGDFSMTDCDFHDWFVDSTIFNLNATTSDPQITIDSGYVSHVHDLYLTGDTSSKDLGNSKGIVLKNCRNFHLSNIVFDYFPGCGLYLFPLNNNPNNNVLIDNIVIRGCSTSSAPDVKQAIVLNGNNIKLENVSFTDPHLTGFNPVYKAINIYDGYDNLDIMIKDIFLSSNWSLDFAAMDRATILENVSDLYYKTTKKSKIKRIYSGWTVDSPVNLTSGQEMTFTRTRIADLLLLTYVGYSLPTGISLINVENNSSNLSFTIKNTTNSTITLNNQTTFYVCYNII